MNNVKTLFAEEEKKSVLLTLTQACNLSCSYCYEKNKSSAVMTYETAIKIIDDELGANDEYKYVSLDLFGGEPLLQFELIKRIVNYIENKVYNKAYVIFIMTNGTLVHGEIKNWLLAHKENVVCGLSLDGTRRMHNINRSNSFDEIDLKFFKDNYPNQDIKMTISVETLPYLYEGIKFCHENGFFVSCNLAYGIDWGAEKNITLLEEQLKLLIDYYINNPGITPASILDSDISLIGYDRENKNRQWCGVGKHTRSYDTDGRCYPCQLFMPLSCGTDKAKKANQIQFIYDDIPLSLLDEKCRECLVREICSSCYGSNYIATGNIYHKDLSLCKLKKIILKATAYLKVMRWQNGQLSLTEDEVVALMRSVKIIQDIDI